MKKYELKKEKNSWNDTTGDYIMNTITYDIGRFIEEHSEYYQTLKKDYEETFGNVVDMICATIFEHGNFIELHWRRISGI